MNEEDYKYITIYLPLSPYEGGLATMKLPFPMTEQMWSQLWKVLNAMRDGIVTKD